jgi:hypothetical protein
MMQRTLITFIGTNDYSETVYEWAEFGKYPSAFVAAALGNFWKPARVIVLATQAAEAKNGARLLQSFAAPDLPVPEFKRLPDGRSEQELWAQFQAIREAIELKKKGLRHALL